MTYFGSVYFANMGVGVVKIVFNWGHREVPNEPPPPLLARSLLMGPGVRVSKAAKSSPRCTLSGQAPLGASVNFKINGIGPDQLGGRFGYFCFFFGSGRGKGESDTSGGLG